MEHSSCKIGMTYANCENDVMERKRHLDRINSDDHLLNTFFGVSRPRPYRTLETYVFAFTIFIPFPTLCSVPIPSLSCDLWVMVITGYDLYLLLEIL